MGSQRVRHDWATFTFTPVFGPVFCTRSPGFCKNGKAWLPHFLGSPFRPAKFGVTSRPYPPRTLGFATTLSPKFFCLSFLCLILDLREVLKITPILKLQPQKDWNYLERGHAQKFYRFQSLISPKHHPIKHHTLPLQWHKLPLRVMQRLGREVSFLTADFFNINKDQISIATARKLFYPAGWTSIVSMIIRMYCHSYFLFSPKHGPSSELLIRFCLILLWAVSRLDGEMLWLHWGMVESPAVFFVKVLR